MQRLNWKVMSLSLALFSAISFILCVAWGALVPPGLHGTRFLEMTDRKSTRLNSSHIQKSRMPSSA